MGAPYLAVARLQKPHGLKGEVVAIALTDQPDAVFAPERVLTVLDEMGEGTERAFTIDRARVYHRRWLFKFRGLDTRDDVAGWGGATLGVQTDELAPPAAGQMYEHEVPGAAVTVRGKVIGVARDLVSVAGGTLLVVDIAGQERLIPFRAPVVVALDRAQRRIEIDPPAGLLEL